MKFKAVNELEHFSFRDAQIQKAEWTGDALRFELEAVIVKADNSQNGNYTDSYAGTTQMELKNAEVQKAVREGYKYYDANDVLREEKPDEPLSEEELAALLKGSKGYYLFDVVKVEDTYNTTNRFLYLVGIDADEETSCWLQIAFDSSELCWDKYMNRVQNG